MKVAFSTSKNNMGYLNRRTVYLCGSIHNTKENDFGVGWRDKITPILQERYGIIVCNPCKDGVGDTKEDQTYFKQLIKDRQFAKVKNDFYRVIRKDLRAVDQADFLLFYHNPTLPTVGSMHEVINASNQKKPVLIVCDEENIEHLNPWLLTLIKPQWLHESFRSMFDYLDKIDATMDINKLDTSHWWF